MKQLLTAILLMLGLIPKSVAEPLDEGAFTDQFVRKLVAADAGLTVKVSGALQLEIVSGDGSISAYLNNAYAEYLRDPSSESGVFETYIAGLLESLEESKPVQSDRIVAVIKDRGWLADMQASTGTNQEYVVEDLNDELVIVYAEDTPRSTRYFPLDKLNHLDIDRQELRSLAIANLRRILPEVEQQRGPLVSMLTAGGDYVASLLLFDELWQGDALEATGEIVVAVPSRDIVLFTDSKNELGVKRLRELAERAYSENSYGVTDKLFVFRGGRFVQLKK